MHDNNGVQLDALLAADLNCYGESREVCLSSKPIARVVLRKGNKTAPNRLPTCVKLLRPSLESGEFSNKLDMIYCLQ